MFARIHFRLRFAFASLAQNTFRQGIQFRQQGWIRRAVIPILSAGYLYHFPSPFILASDDKKEAIITEQKVV